MHLEERLRSLGEHLDVGDDTGDTLPVRVTARLNETTIDPTPHGRPWLRSAAAALVALAVVAAAVPASRETVATWFGLDGVRIERSVNDEPSAKESSVVGLPGPGVTREVTVDGRVVLVSVIDGALTSEILVKTLGPDTEIEEVDVGNAPGLWISGEPHELAYESPDGVIQFERVAGNTLVWQNEDVIGRLEGFDSVEAAIAYAILTGTAG